MTNKLGYEIQKTEEFEKLVKELAKRFRSIHEDIEHFENDLDDTSKLGAHLGRNLYKARIANSDKHRGKRVGYRLISYLKLTKSTLTYLYIYDKGDMDDLSEEKLDRMILQLIDQTP